MKTENDMIKKLVQDELEKEAEQIKREMEQEPKLSEGVPSPEMKSTIWRRAEEIRRQKEAYDNLSEADKEALRLGREFQLRREEKEKEEISEELIPESLELAAGAEQRRHSNQAEQEKSVLANAGKRRWLLWSRHLLRYWDLELQVLAIKGMSRDFLIKWLETG